MKLGRMIELAGGTKNDFDGAHRREVLPFKPKASYSKDADGVVDEFVQHGPYTFSHLVLFKVYVDLIRSGLPGTEAQAFTRSVNSFGIAPRGFPREVEKVNFLDHEGDDLWIAREIFTANYFSDPRLDFAEGQYFDAHHWAGKRGDIDEYTQFVNSRETEDERQTMSLHVYNLSKTVRELRSKVAALGMIEAHDRGPYVQLAGYVNAD